MFITLSYTMRKYECRRCGSHVFYSSGNKRWCAPCQKERSSIYAKSHKSTKRRFRLYGMDKIDFDKALCDQNNCCAICQVPLDKSFCVDHDHAARVVRGLLCNTCNLGLGHFRDNADTLYRAIEYLKRHAQVAHRLEHRSYESGALIG